MNMTAKLSVILNLALAGALICVWMSARTPGTASAPPTMTPAEQTSAPTVSEPAPPAAPQAVVKTKPFRWNQLLSANDYRVFVANLRAAGCPEATVEDIVRGDAERAFFLKRGELHVDGAQPGPWSAQSQMQMVAYLLGQASSPTVEVADNTAPLSAGHSSTVEVADNTVSPPANRPPSENSVVSTPLILRQVDLKALGLNSGQIQAFNKVRQDFLSQVGGGNQDSKNPSDSANASGATDSADPAYVAQVQQAEDTADNQLPAVLGDAYGTYMWMAAAQDAYDYSVRKLQSQN